MTAHLSIRAYQTPGQEQLKLELCFYGQECSRVPAILGNTYGNQTRRLDLSFNVISSLDGLDRFPFLEELILDNNLLADDAEWPSLPYLTTLSLNKNMYCDLSSLLRKLQQSCPHLRYFSLLNNFASPDQLSSDCNEHQYELHRLVVLQHLPKLKFLDSRRVRPCETMAAREAGSALFSTLQRPKLWNRLGDSVIKESRFSNLLRQYYEIIGQMNRNDQEYERRSEHF